MPRRLKSLPLPRRLPGRKGRAQSQDQDQDQDQDMAPSEIRGLSDLPPGLQFELRAIAEAIARAMAQADHSATANPTKAPDMPAGDGRDRPAA